MYAAMKRTNAPRPAGTSATSSAASPGFSTSAWPARYAPYVAAAVNPRPSSATRPNARTWTTLFERN